MTVAPNTTQPRPEEPQTTQALSESPHANHRRSRMLWFFTLLLAVLALGWLLLWLFYLQYHVSTDDAYANGSMVNVNPAITGSVIAFYADDTDLVVEGQLLARLDSTYYQALYEKALAELAAQAIQVKQFYDDLLVNQAAVEIRKTSLSKARFDYQNRLQLVDSKAISNEDFIHSRDELTIAENELKKAEYQLKTSQDMLGTTSLETHPLLEVKRAAVKDAYYHLKHCDLYAPATGYVAQRSVNVGQSATPTTDLMAIIPTDYVWVDANFKETQLSQMRVGQPATVWFDLYGSDVKYQGKVLGIASGSGSVFSLIPPQNATGNWIKIVQRLPVRISLDPEVVKKYPIRLGISAEVDVDITEQNLPMLTQTSPSKAVAQTEVYNIHLEEVEQIMNEIVMANLYPLAQ